MITARFVLFVCIASLPGWLFAQVAREHNEDFVSTYSKIPELQEANAVIWCQPIPDCSSWTKTDPSANTRAVEPESIQGKESEDSHQYLGSVFIIIVTNTQEQLSPEIEEFIHILVDSLREQNVKITGAAFIPPSPDTDKLREWVYAQCINCQ